MRLRLASTLALALEAGSALPSGAATLLAPPFVLLEGDQVVQCSATNTSGSKTIEVRIELLDDDGVVVDSTTSTLAPLHTRSLASDTGALSTLGCRMVFSGSKKNVRGTLMLQSIGVGSAETLAVLPLE